MAQPKSARIRTTVYLSKGLHAKLKTKLRSLVVGDEKVNVSLWFREQAIAFVEAGK